MKPSGLYYAHSLVKRIPLHDRAGRVVAQATVDDADFAWLNQWPWSLVGRSRRDRTDYAARREGHRKVRMHRAILGLAYGDSRRTDHADGNGLNNQRSNLRVTTHAGNMQNKRSYRGASSVHRGVSWDKQHSKWRASAKLNGKQYFLGLFDDEEAAATTARAWRAAFMPLSTNDRKGQE